MGASGSTPISSAQHHQHHQDSLHSAPSWSSLAGDVHTDGRCSPSHYPFAHYGYPKTEPASSYPLSGHYHHHHKLDVTSTTKSDGKKRKGNLGSLATLRKRLVRRARRASKNYDHNQILKEFLSGWSTRDLMSLVEEYEASSLLKELWVQAEIARPSASTVAQDLAELYDFKYAADTYLIYSGLHFPVHKAIVCVRCPLFRELLGKVNQFGARVPVNLDIPVELFNDLLRYLYSGEFVLTTTSGPESAQINCSSSTSSYESILLRLSQQFGVPNALDQDLKHLQETGVYSDASLLFSPPPLQFQANPGALPLPSIKKCRACADQAEFSCHSAILSSRSPFFRNVIQRHQRRSAEAIGIIQDTGNGSFINTANQKIRIVLDESIIPRRFARLILHSMYRDSTDLVQLLPLCVCKCVPNPQIEPLTGHNSGSLSSLGSSSSAPSTPSASGTNALVTPVQLVKEVMDLYEIARFLELDSLIQSCEDMIIDSLSIETLVMILKWSEQPHGSPWVKRQALCFLREEFSSLASSHILYQLDHSHLLEAIKSDYLQASELEVLQAVIKWGENRLMKRMEDRGLLLLIIFSCFFVFKPILSIFFSFRTKHREPNCS